MSRECSITRLVGVTTPKELKLRVDNKILQLSYGNTICGWELPANTKLNHLSAKLVCGRLHITIPQYTKSKASISEALDGLQDMQLD